MPTKAIANGANEAERKAARDANEVQDGVNLVAIVVLFIGISLPCGIAASAATLNNHPVSIAFVSKLNALCRLTEARKQRH